jgi:hypothetical protein
MNEVCNYPIERLDAMMFGNNLAQYPVLYIKPDKYLLRFVRENKNQLMCNIFGTDSDYDNNQYNCYVISSEFMPDRRPNFFKKTGYYCVVLNATFTNYITNNKGFVSFSGVRGDDPSKLESIATSGDSKNDMKFDMILKQHPFITVAVVIVIIALAFGVYRVSMM